MRRTLLLLVASSLATTASAAWYPVFDPTYVRVEVGETRTVRVRAVWTGTWILPWANWYIRSTHPLVAQVDTTMTDSGSMDVPITGLTPGEAGVYVRGYADHRPYVYVDVACGTEPVVEKATPAEVRTAVGTPVELRVETSIAHRTAFTWYRGRNGDTSTPVVAAAGPSLTVTPQARGTEYFWVMATTPCSRSAAEFRVDAGHGKQRSARR